MYTERYLINQCTRGNTLYAMKKSDVNQFLEEFNDYYTLETVKTDFSQYILSLRVYPISFNISDTRNPWGFDHIDNIHLGDKYCEAQGYKRVEDSYSLGVFTSGVSYVDLVDDDDYEWLSYSPYATANLYIPFCGYHEIDINAIMQKYVQTEFCIDVATGICTVYLFVSDTFEGTNARVVYQTSFQIGIDCPFSSDGEGLRSRVQTYNLIKDSINAVGSIVMGGATTGKAGAVIGAVSGATNIANNYLQNSPRLLMGGSYDGVWNRTIEDLTPHIIIAYRDITSFSKSSFVEYRGNKTFKPVTTLSGAQCTGFTQMLDVHLDNFPTATSSELEELRELLLSGVRLPT